MKSFIRTILNWLKLSLFIALLVGVVAGLGWFNFHVWRVSHPSAPTWTYFFSAHN